MYKDYKKEVKLTLIIEHAQSAGEALYRLEEVMDSIMAKYHGDDDDMEYYPGCVAICEDEEKELMIDISQPKEGEESCKREWAIVEAGQDVIMKTKTAEQSAN